MSDAVRTVANPNRTRLSPDDQLHPEPRADSAESPSEERAA